MTAGNAAPAPKDSVTFLCRPCGEQFRDRPELINDAPDDDYHPWRYFAYCPSCHELVEQAWWERNLLKAWANSTGPRTPEGRQRSASNLEGHPTPEEALRTRFNAVKHGIYAQTATYFPAKPGAYPECQDCELRDTICPSERACLKKTELFMKHHIAFDSRDPSALMDIHAANQAAISAMINQMFLAIALDGGPSIRQPVWTTDSKGRTRLVSFIDDNTGQRKYLEEIKAHPLLRHLMDYIHKNNITMADLEMTPKAKDEQDALKGFLDAPAGERPQQDALEFQAEQRKQMTDLRKMIERSQSSTEKDPVLIEYNQGEDSG